jgi:UDP-2,3-diacylglucosamine hydrolase
LLTAAPRTLFISDLHLSASRPHTTELLLNFISSTAHGAEALYVLGDLFEYWAGDDDLEATPHRQVCDALRQLSDSGTPVYFMHGNRDFLISERFAQIAGVTLLPDPFLLELYGQRALLTHGDAMCTEDIDYQAFRHQVRDPGWQSAFLAQPLAERRAQIEALRMHSETEKSYKAADIMDVNLAAVQDLLRRHGYPALLIHGHTHRPAAHKLELDGHYTTRWVLGDWDHSGDYLYCDAGGCARGRVPSSTVAVD